MSEKKITKSKHKKKPSATKKPFQENVNSFLYKLWSLVHDESLPTISWSPDGENIVIDNPAKFTLKVLNSERKVFKTKHLASFIRQLNLYGFHRVKENNAKTPIVFKHDSFKRGRLDLVADIKRKKPNPALPFPNVSSLPRPVPSNQKSVATNGTFQQQYMSSAAPCNYPANLYYNSSAVRRGSAMMPTLSFPSPFAVNHGPTFINLGQNAPTFGKKGKTQTSEDKMVVKQKPCMDKQCQTVQPVSRALPVPSPYYPWQYGGYQYPQAKVGSTSAGGLGPVYGNDVAFQMMMHNQSTYGNYVTPSSSMVKQNNCMFAETTPHSYTDFQTCSTTTGPSDNSFVSFKYSPQVESSPQTLHYDVTTSEAPAEKLEKSPEVQSQAFTSSQLKTTTDVSSDNLAAAVFRDVSVSLTSLDVKPCVPELSL